MKTIEQSPTPAAFPACFASPTSSRFGTAGIYTKDGSYDVFDATAPGMTPEKSLERAKHIVLAVENRPQIHEQAKAGVDCLEKGDVNGAMLCLNAILGLAS